MMCAVPAAVQRVHLQDNFTGTDNAAWDSTRWPTKVATSDIQTNRGHVTGNPARTFNAVAYSDFEMTVKGTWSTLTSRVPEFGWRITTPFANPVGAGYALQIDSTSGGKATMFKVPSYSTLVGVTSATLAGTGGVWFRLRCIGSNHKIRWWADGSAEGSTWPIDQTDATTASGRIYLGMWTSGDVYWDDLTVIAL